jgi:hypothetical protein
MVAPSAHVPQKARMARQQLFHLIGRIKCCRNVFIRVRNTDVEPYSGLPHWRRGPSAYALGVILRLTQWSA